MEANSTTIRCWEDVVFSHRNKSYGAYLLRRGYPLRLLTGAGLSIALVLALLFLQGVGRKPDITRGTMMVLDSGGHKLTPPPFIPPRKMPEQRSRPAVQHADPRHVMITSQEVEEDVPPLLEDISFSFDGDESGLSGDVGEEGPATLSMPEPSLVIEREVLDIAEVMPDYEGGMEALMKFIRKHIRYPSGPRAIGIEGTVYVRFVVQGDGSVTDVEIIRGVHPDYDREAKRVISKLPDWKGGSHNGNPVAVRMVLPIKFNLQ